MSRVKTSVALVHPTGLFHDGLVSLLMQNDSYSVTEVHDFETLEHMIGENQQFDVALIEAAMTERRTNLLVARLRSIQPSCRIALLAETLDEEEVVRAYMDGVDGLILKAVCGEALLGSLRLIVLGEKLFPPALAKLLSDEHSKVVPHNGAGLSVDSTFSSRESDVLRCLVEGDSNKRIAIRLNIAEATVKIHLKSILRKAGVSNRTQAAIWAFQRGIALVIGASVAVFANLDLLDIDFTSTILPWMPIGAMPTWMSIGAMSLWGSG